MIWRNPWAFFGALAVGVPVLIHLLSRRQAHVIRFPTLRFIDATRTVPIRRTRIADPLVLAVRALIVLAAVAALAQPLRMNAARSAVRDAAVARVIVVDTSASMSRRDSTGAPARVTAVARAEELRRDATASVVVSSVAPASDIAGSLAWLDAQPSMREVVIVSDFQLGVLDSVDVAAMPADVGLRLVRVPVVSDSTALRPRSGARARVRDGSTTVEWSPSRDDPMLAAPRIVSGPADALTADAMRAAMRAFPAVGAPDTSRRIAIVLPGAPGRAQLVRDATPLDKPWMASVLISVERDSLAAGAARSMTTARGLLDGRPTLLFFVSDSTSPYAAAATAVAAFRASAVAPVAAEAEPELITDAMLRSWERVPTPPPPGRVRGLFDESDGRWLWTVALALLGVEWLLRRTAARSDGAVAVPSEPVKFRAA